MDFELARRNMVVSQVQTNEVTDPLVIEAIGRVPRERFLPAARQAQAYVDEDVLVADGRWLMEPMVAAKLLQLARWRVHGRHARLGVKHEGGIPPAVDPHNDQVAAGRMDRGL